MKEVIVLIDPIRAGKSTTKDNLPEQTCNEIISLLKL